MLLCTQPLAVLALDVPSCSQPHAGNSRSQAMPCTAHLPEQRERRQHQAVGAAHPGGEAPALRKCLAALRQGDKQAAVSKQVAGKQAAGSS